MPRHGAKYQSAKAGIATGDHTAESAVLALKEASFAKFDETVDLAMNLGVDPRHADQMVRGSVVLPHGTGRVKRVLVIAQGEKIKEAEAAGADFAGSDDMVTKVAEGWLDFDAVVATPDMMREVGKLGRILGPRGLMPNPKTGTVTFDVGKAVAEIKGGKLDYRVDKNGVIHVPVGRLSFEPKALVENLGAIFEAVLRGRPSASKGRYLKSIYVSSTMGPSIPLDVGTVTLS